MIEMLEEKTSFQTDAEGKDIRVIDIREKTIPKEFRWILMLDAVKKRAEAQGKLVKFEFTYSNHGRLETYDKLHYFELDSEGQSYVPIRPTEVRLVEHVLGMGFVRTVAQFNGTLNSLDPILPVAMEIFGIASGL